MAAQKTPRTATLNGRLWGARARDWADVQEGVVRPVYEAVFERTGVGVGVRYLDVGCGSGMAARLAAERGAQVSGIDAAEALLAIARSRLPNADFHQGDIEELPFGHEIFDGGHGFQLVSICRESDRRVVRSSARDKAKWYRRDCHMGQSRKDGSNLADRGVASVIATPTSRRARTICSVRRGRFAQIRLECRFDAHRGDRCG